MYKRVGHIALRTKDLDASLAFYCGILGMREGFRMYNDEGKVSTVYVCIAPGQFIEIFPGGTIKQNQNTDVIGYSHLCIEVENAAETLELLRAKGIPVDTEIKTGLSKCKMFWTHDPDGNRIEFMELTPESLQQQAIDRLGSSNDGK